MFQFHQENEFDCEQSLAACNHLLAVMSELGLDTSVGFGLSSAMDLEQLQSMQATLAQIIEQADEEAQAKLRKMKLCPQGYKWHAEGNGYRCDGGSHFISGAEIENFME